MLTKDGMKEVSNDLVAFYGFPNLIQKVKILKFFLENGSKTKEKKVQIFCQHEVDLELYVLIGEMSLACTQSTVTPGVHQTFKIAALKNLMPCQRC